MDILAVKAPLEAGVANPEPGVGVGLLASLERVARRVVLLKGLGVGLVLPASRPG